MRNETAKAKSDLPQKLAFCSSFDEQVAWCRRALEQGRTLTDPGLWISGCNPDKVIRKLRRQGLAIKTVYVKTVDAAGEVHPRTLAWRL